LDWLKYIRWLAGRFTRPGTPKVCLVVVCAVTLAGVFGVLVSKQGGRVLRVYSLGVITVQTFQSLSITATNSRNLLGEPPSSQNSGSFDDAIRDASAPDIDDRF